MKLFNIKPWLKMLLLICLVMTMLTFMTGAAAPGKAANGGKGNYALTCLLLYAWLGTKRKSKKRFGRAKKYFR